MAANDHTPPALPVKIPIIAKDLRRSAGNTALPATSAGVKLVDTSPSGSYAAAPGLFWAESGIFCIILLTHKSGSVLYVWYQTCVQYVAFRNGRPTDLLDDLVGTQQN